MVSPIKKFHIVSSAVTLQLEESTIYFIHRALTAFNSLVAASCTEHASASFSNS